MNFEALRGIAQTNDWFLIWPEISLAVFALVLLMAEFAVPARRQGYLPAAALLFQGALGLLLGAVTFQRLQAGGTDTLVDLPGFAGLIAISPLGEGMRLFFLLGSFLVSYLAMLYLRKQELPRNEMYVLILIVTAALMLLVHSRNFVMLFVALETVTVGFYVLVAYARTSSLSLEAGLKYLILGALSSAILLFGIVLLYGAAGNPELAASSNDALTYAPLQAFLEANPENLVARVGAVLVLCGIAFKIGTVPFQIWIPDVYQGAPTPVAAFLAVSSKAAGFLVLLELVRPGSGPLAPLVNQGGGMLFALLAAMTLVTILFGNIVAIPQRNVKRLMGLSGIAHAGYLMLGVLAFAQGVEWAAAAAVFYLFTYLLGSFAVFAVMGHLAGRADDTQELEHYADLGRRHPALAAVLAIGLGSLAGIPPLAGFIGKFLLFVAAYQAGLHTLLIVAIAGVVISIYYYFGWVREAYFFRRAEGGEPAREEPEAPVQTPVLLFGDRVVLAILAVATVLLGFYQGIFGGWIFG